MLFQNILEAVGRTPLIRLQRLGRELKPSIWVKAEFLNPGGSVKDRIAVRMVAQAEQEGRLRPGGTIIEGTSGNTGIGLALVAALKGYKLVFTITDKQSREKINLLKALGAEVIVCPTAVEPEDPRSYYCVAKKLAREIPNAFYPNQYANPENPLAHYHTTGPEIWEDTQGRITHFVCGMGTGGTISGVGKFLKEKNPKVRVVGVDPEGSVYFEHFRTGEMGKAAPYKVEGIGEDFLPGTMDFSVVDEVMRVTDRDSFVLTRRLASREGILAGGSSGSAVWAALELARQLTEKDWVVILLPDTGMRYLSKIYNEEWMRENQYFDSQTRLYASDILEARRHFRGPRSLIAADPKEGVLDALKKIRDHDISQIPVFENGVPVGAVYEDEILHLVLEGKPVAEMIVREVMQPPLPVVEVQARIESITQMIRTDQPAVLVQLGSQRFDIITKYDIVHALAELAEKKKNGS
ncbi:MAG: cystathionine beta-synthase [Elusimicrobia bacterium]|nr:cystathionine beta-synthase [Elusimicrobiota bacterium]